MNQNDTEVTFKGTLYIHKDDTFSIGAGCPGPELISCLRSILSINHSSESSDVYNDVGITIKQKRRNG